ncbi:General transcription factor IIE subunit 1-like protein [Dinothrombium tinctorium]|uniref:General transcription factor IIE subunit 1 n=1 Tax=Dinothrombium tinctorium TaxID=1965070 RepID=A0A3S3SMM7_9ACAR|nr:General transcription factor IIE subunit 1-like protein [Dinothrombium tinctorium]RWS16239.1 General transcription factor IIE subunit 1-like protein [Dinothrombium tinctorium]
MEVPTALKRLIRMVTRGFYAVEHILVVDMLIRKMCVKEDDLESLLKFERKQLRAIIAQLKNDKIIKSKLKMETGPDGKTSRCNYYYINYRAFVNVVKYKLDHMRRKIETEERDNTSRASFICTQCKKTFTDLEADQLCDLTTGEFRCSYCGELVEEDPNVLPKADSRLILAKFNEQIEPLYILLKEVEDIKLPSDLLEPEPIIETPNGIKSEASVVDDRTNIFSSNHWKDGDRNKGINSEYENMLFNERSLTVKIESVNDSIDKSSSKESKSEETFSKKKEQPSWLVESTVYDTPHTISNPVKKFTEKETPLFNNSPAEDSVGSTKEILEALLVHEKQQESSSTAISAIQGSEKNDFFGTNGEINDGFNNDELMESDDEDAGDRTPMVSVGGQLVSLSDINDDHIAAMNALEKEEYIRLTQEVYAHIYE